MRICLLLLGLYAWTVEMEANFEFELPDLPQLVNLVDSKTDSDGELNVTSLDKMLQPEDFGVEFRLVCISIFMNSLLSFSDEFVK